MPNVTAEATTPLAKANQQARLGGAASGRPNNL